MVQIPNDQLRRLLDTRATCVSIYLPTHRRSPESDQDPIRLKNAIRQADTQLRERGIRQLDIDKILQPARALLEDDPFWIHKGDGLAAFLTYESTSTYRFPLSFSEMVVVNDRFHLKPLFPLINERTFHILAVSQNGARLFEASLHGVRETRLENAPASLSEGVALEDAQQNLQLHAAGKAGGSTGARPATYHGPNVDKDEAALKKQAERYVQKLQKAVTEQLTGRREPLVFAGSEALAAMYKSVNTYTNLLETAVEGNVELLRGEELHRAAWPLVEPLFSRRFEQDADRFRQLAGKGKGSIRLEEILPAAREGRVETLFVALDHQRWGRYDAEAGPELHPNRMPGDEDLLDRVALETWFTGGRVHAVPRERIPAPEPVAAILRF